MIALPLWRIAGLDLLFTYGFKISGILSYNPKIFYDTNISAFPITNSLEHHSTNLRLDLYEVISEASSTEIRVEMTFPFSG